MGRSSNEIDWEAIERDYRIGALTIIQIADKYEVAKGSIHRRATKHKWSRDLSEQVKVIARAKVNEAIVKEVTEKRLSGDALDTSSVENQSNIVAHTVKTHHKVNGRLESLMLSMIDELEDQTANMNTVIEIRDLISIENPNAAQAVYKMTTIGSRMSTLKSAAEIHEKVVKLDRQALGIDENHKQEDPELESAIKRLRNHPEFSK